MAEATRQLPPAMADLERTPEGGAFAVGVLVLALLLLLLVPIVVRRRSDEIRRAATEVAEPARDLAEDLSRDMAVEADAIRLFALTQDPVSRLKAEAAAADGTRTLQRLEPLLARLDPELARRGDTLQSSWDEWRSVSVAVLGGTSVPGSRAPGEALERAFQAMVTASAELDTDIGRTSALRREQARRIDTLATVVTASLVLIVLGAMIALARLYGRLRILAEVNRRRAQQEVTLRREIQSAMESRARLIRGFSHDVRNPLGAADGYGQLLETGVFGDMTERQVQSVRRLRRAIGAAVLLTDDLLDLARLEAGQLQTARDAVDLLPIVRETVDDYRAQAATSGLELELELPERVALIQSDERRIRQILSNLLSNAIKYTPTGGRVTVRLGDHHPHQPGHWLGVRVTDTGPGIPEEQRARIFEEFSRLEPTAAHGVGLGLAISRRLARALGGEITLESKPGDGSTFTLWLPADGPTAA